MRADLGLAVAQHAHPARLEPVARGKDILDLVADMVDTARGVLFQKAPDRAVRAQRIKQLDLGVGQLDEHHRHTVIGLVLRRADMGTQRIAVLGARGLEIGHGDGDMVETSDHGALLGLRVWPRYGGSMPPVQADVPPQPPVNLAFTNAGPCSKAPKKEGPSRCAITTASPPAPPGAAHARFSA